MERYQTILAYDGTHFLGFQRSESLRTVQGEVEAALRRLGWRDRTILYAGRTDTGVHASGQVIAFDLEWSHTCGELLRALNANLPEDIAVEALQVAAPDFHPRFHAIRRCYQYRIFCQPQRDPLKERYAWRVWPAVDEQRLHEAARLLIGVHDFAAFGTPPRVGGSTVRTIFDAVWKPQPQDLLFEVAATAFLYHMVRRIVFLQVLVGLNRLDLKQLALAVDIAQPQTPGLAPSHGLVMVEVNYPEDRQDL